MVIRQAMKRGGNPGEVLVCGVYPQLGAAKTFQFTVDSIAYVLGVLLGFRTLHNVVPRYALAGRTDRCGWMEIPPPWRRMLLGGSGPHQCGNILPRIRKQRGAF